MCSLRSELFSYTDSNSLMRRFIFGLSGISMLWLFIFILCWNRKMGSIARPSFWFVMELIPLGLSNFMSVVFKVQPALIVISFVVPG